MDGVIVIDKPEGWTSHDVVARVKKTLGAGKVGHLGTLDPIATGVLPLVVNRATKFARLLEGTKKVYHAGLRLGETTETYDSEGDVVETADPSGLTEDEIRAAFAPFVGVIKQVPPMYSSVKKGGVPLYKLARKGVVVEREPKEVEIAGIEITSVAVPDVEFILTCSRGTYVRSLCHDVGAALGCGAHMTWLRRLVSGRYTIDEAVDVRLGAEELAAAIIPLSSALEMSIGGLAQLEVSPAVAVTFRNSATVTIEGEEAFFAFLKPKEMVRFVSSGQLAAVAEFIGTAEDDGPAGRFNVIKVFRPGTAAAEALRLEKINLIDRVC